jgi:hypothetical protein
MTAPPPGDVTKLFQPKSLYELSRKKIYRHCYRRRDANQVFYKLPTVIGRDLAENITDDEMAFNRFCTFREALAKHVFQLQWSNPDFVIGDLTYHTVVLKAGTEIRRYRFTTVCYRRDGCVLYYWTRNLEDLHPKTHFRHMMIFYDKCSILPKEEELEWMEGRLSKCLSKYHLPKNNMYWS